MPISLKDLKSLAEGEDLRYFLSPDGTALLAGFGGLTGNYQVLMKVEIDGRFLQFRTLGYTACPADHPHLEVVLKILGHLNYERRLVKFGWDPSDGEIVAYADMWVEDGKVTQKQFKAIMSTFLPAIDLANRRIQEALRSGTDSEANASDDPLAGIRELLRQAGIDPDKLDPDDGPAVI